MDYFDSRERLVVAPLFDFDAKDFGEDKFPEKVSLNGGYQIKRVNPKHFEEAFEFYSVYVSEYDKNLFQNCTHAIYYRYTANNDEPELPNEIRLHIDRIVETLYLIRPCRVTKAIFHLKVKANKFSTLQFVHKSNHRILHMQSPGSTLNRTGIDELFVKSDANKIRLYWRQILILSDNYTGKYHKVLNALFFFVSGLYSLDYKPRMILFVTGLESIYNTSNDQVGLSMRLRCSYMLRVKASERNELSNTIKEIYNIRSTFVHGQGMSPKLLKNHVLQQEYITKTEDILRETLVYIIENKLMDLFAKPKELETSFNNLVLSVESKLYLKY